MKKIYLIIFAITFLSLLTFKNFAQPCTGVPASNTAVASSTAFCVGTNVTLSLTVPYTATGIVYQWVYSSSSALGPWSPISGATNSVLTTNTFTAPGYYTAVIVCTNAFTSNTATAVFLQVNSGGATTTVPYYEGFQVAANNLLPNCSWSATSLGTNCVTFSNTTAFSGTGAGAFSYSTMGTHAFYSMGIQLNAGVTYSASIWQTTNNFVNQNVWSNFRLAFGPNQSATGSANIATAVTPATTSYANVSGTFVVPNTGIYYIGIYATSAVNTTSTQYLYFDDLAVTIPCTGNSGNLPTATLSPSSGTICSGQTATINVLTGPNTTVSPGNSFTLMPQTTTSYSVMLTNTLSGCISNSTVMLNVNASPNVSALVSPPICAGETASVNVFGATTNSLNGVPITGTTIVVSPFVTTTYTLTGGNAQCTSDYIFTVTVKSTPTVTAVASNSNLCLGETILLNAGGAFDFQWVGYSATSSLTFAPTSNMTFTVIGRSSANCFDTTTVNVIVNACLNINTISSLENILLSPNPNDGVFKITGFSGEFKVKLYDISGKLIHTFIGSEQANIDISQQPDGIYFVALNSSIENKVIKIVKRN